MTRAPFPPRLRDTGRYLGRRAAPELRVSEDRLYAEPIHGGLPMRECLLCMNRLRAIAASTHPEDAPGILDAERRAASPILDERTLAPWPGSGRRSPFDTAGPWRRKKADFEFGPVSGKPFSQA
ncbi:MAG: hypothetical protein LBD06_11725 [Candidatus Accumulibacter sp.]|jgi:hypothetical protein|nr:hypothetical protein [Accumulibacter sp.]